MENHFIKLTDSFDGVILEKLNKDTNFAMATYYPEAMENLQSYCSGILPKAVADNIMKVVYANNREHLDMDEWNFIYKTVFEI